MAEQPLKPEQPVAPKKKPTSRCSSKGVMKILKAVRAGTMTAIIASQALTNLGCGGKAVIDTDKVEQVDKEKGKTTGGEEVEEKEEEEGCMGAEGCMGS